MEELSENGKRIEGGQTGRGPPRAARPRSAPMVRQINAIFQSLSGI